MSPRGGRSRRWLKCVRFAARMRKSRGRVEVFEEWLRLDKQTTYSMFRLDAQGRRVFLAEPRVLFVGEGGVFDWYGATPPELISVRKATDAV